eukprot:8821730-Karenia_brevis.AAC.1
MGRQLQSGKPMLNVMFPSIFYARIWKSVGIEMGRQPQAENPMLHVHVSKQFLGENVGVLGKLDDNLNVEI